jgi:ribulose-bisphosphate carboxylase small chain
VTAAGTRRLETFSFLAPLTDEEIALQIAGILEHALVPAIEHAADPGPRSVYWSMWKLPLFDARTAGDVLSEIEACAAANPQDYVKLIGYDPKRQGQVASFVVRRPN